MSNDRHCREPMSRETEKMLECLNNLNQAFQEAGGCIGNWESKRDFVQSETFKKIALNNIRFIFDPGDIT